MQRGLPVPIAWTARIGVPARQRRFGQDRSQPCGFGYIRALLLVLWAGISILQNSLTSALGKAIWIAIVLFIPLFGFIAWLFFGPKADKRTPV